MNAEWGTILDRVSGVITKILRQANDCSNFFNNSPIVQAFGMINEVSGHGPTDALGFFNTDTLKPSTTTPNNNPYPNSVGAETTEYTGANSVISINANRSGAFVGGYSGQLGPFATGSLAGQVTMMLHELAHTVGAIGPDNAAAVKAGYPTSQDNTKTVLKHCRKAIAAAVNSVSH